MTRIKRVFSVLLIVLMLVSVNVPAFAVTKPSVSRYTTSQTTVKRGKSISWKFNLKSGSYTKKSGVWRARFTSIIVREKTKTTVASYDIVYTGNLRQTVKWTAPKKIATGKYSNRYCTSYRSNASKQWTMTNNRFYYFYFKVAA